MLEVVPASHAKDPNNHTASCLTHGITVSRLTTTAITVDIAVGCNLEVATHFSSKSRLGYDAQDHDLAEISLVLSYPPAADQLAVTLPSYQLIGRTFLMSDEVF